MRRPAIADPTHRPFRGRRRISAAWSRPALYVQKIFALVAALLAAIPASAAGPSLENAVKATYLFKFTPFITWPDAAFAGANGPFDICVVGDDAFADMVAQATAGQRYGSHNIAVRKLSTPDPDCQVLYIPGSDTSTSAVALNALRGKPILTVTDAAPDPAAAHGIVVFMVDAGHVRFDIDGAAATQDGLTISSKLLSLSRSASQRSAP